MISTRIGITDALYNAEFSRLHQLRQRARAGMEADAVGMADHSLARDGKGGPKSVVGIIFNRYDGIEAIISSRQVNKHECACFGGD